MRGVKGPTHGYVACKEGIAKWVKITNKHECGAEDTAIALYCRYQDSRRRQGQEIAYTPGTNAFGSINEKISRIEPSIPSRCTMIGVRAL